MKEKRNILKTTYTHLKKSDFFYLQNPNLIPVLNFQLILGLKMGQFENFYVHIVLVQ